MRNEKEKIIISALLHDIGKFIYRSIDSQFQKEARHQELGREWAKKVGLHDEVITAITRHHRLRKDDKKYHELSVDSYKGDIAIANLIKLIDFSDNISSGMEREQFENDTGHFKADAGLKPIFSEISLSDGGESNDIGKSTENNKSINKINKNVSLLGAGKSQATNGESPKKDGLVWEAKNIQFRPYPVEIQGEILKYESFYKKQWTSFVQEFDAIKSNLNEEILLMLLQKYAMQIPEHTWVVSEQLPDTSLYHHLKSTAAIAWCNYKYIIEEKIEEKAKWLSSDLGDLIYNEKEEKFLLIAGDLSGIQSFIYTLTSKEALKTVRGRSFYLELLMETAVQKLIEKLDLCYSCIIYNSGGSFYILAPNTKNVKEELERQKTEINNYLYEKFGLTLYLALGFRPLSPEDLKKEDGKLKDAWGQIKEDLGREKGQKWSYLFSDENKFKELFEPKVIEKECIICRQPVKGSPINDNTDDKCDVCNRMIEIGEKLAISEEKDKRLYLVSDKKQSDIEIFDEYYYTFDEPARKDDIKKIYLLENLWDTSFGHNIRNFPTGTYIYQKELAKLVEYATGFERLGILRMDVDHLGAIFSRGLKGRATFARLNDLSERINLYFKYYVPHILKENVSSALTNNDKRKHNKVNLIYSGGDDLFLLGTWDSVLDVSWLIYSDFKKYVGYNKDLSLSAGYVLADERMAFYRLADTAGSEEKRAKENGRDSISIFGKPLKWEKIKALKEEDEKKNTTLADILSIITKGLEFTEDKAICKG
ncbi:MAG TPA: type III-A CRISPR-associated protein Cas10/Csm1, partial [Clostridiaceae bacterium]|nr:type III-A CRISPR-associated protein Cas10/Csm1 [Clostridiaceae bacterium]